MPNEVGSSGCVFGKEKSAWKSAVELVRPGGRVLWFGGFRISPSMNNIIATKLPEKITWVRKAVMYDVPLSEPKQYIYEPDPAFIKAHFISDIAKEYDLCQVSDKIAYLTGDTHIDSPILKGYRVLSYMPLDYDMVNKRISELNLGKLDFKARGISVDLKNIHNSIKGSGKIKGLIIFTKIINKPAAILCKYIH